MRENFRKETVFLRNDLRVKRLELKILWIVPKPDKDKIIDKQKELIGLTTQLKIKAIDFRLEARSYLTPEQASQVGMWGRRCGTGAIWARECGQVIHRDVAIDWVFCNREASLKMVHNAPGSILDHFTIKTMTDKTGNV